MKEEYRDLCGDVVLPDTITEIEDWAFSCNINITSIIIPEGVTKIGKNAFHLCDSLKSVVIPNSVNEIGDSAFDGCVALEQITIPRGVTKIDRYTFDDCESLKNIEIPDTVTIIGFSVFNGCKLLENVVIPESVTRIDGNAFRDCKSLTSIKIPNNVTAIDNGAFDGCDSIKTILIPESVTYLGAVFDKMKSLETFINLSNIYTSFSSNKKCKIYIAESLYLKEQLLFDRDVEDDGYNIRVIKQDAVSKISAFTGEITDDNIVDIIGKDGFFKVEPESDDYNEYNIELGDLDERAGMVIDEITDFISLEQTSCITKRNIPSYKMNKIATGFRLSSFKYSTEDVIALYDPSPTNALTGKVSGILFLTDGFIYKQSHNHQPVLLKYSQISYITQNFRTLEIEQKDGGKLVLHGISFSSDRLYTLLYSIEKIYR